MNTQELRARVFESLNNAGENGYDFRGCDAEGVILDLQSYDADCDTQPASRLRPHVVAWLAEHPSDD